MSGKSLTTIVVVFLAAIVLANTIYIVDETETAVRLRFGSLDEADIKPGLHFKMPIIDKISKFDTRILALDSKPQRYLTLEKKFLVVDSYATWRIVDSSKYYTATAGNEFQAVNLLSSRIDNGLRDQFGRRSVHEVVSGERDELMTELTTAMNDIARKEFGIEINDIRVKAIDLPTQVSESVYNRMRTERERIAQEHRSQGKRKSEIIKAAADKQQRTIIAEAYRDAEKIRGGGDAKATATYAAAFEKDPEFYSFSRSLSAYRHTFSNKSDLMVIDPQSDFLKYLKNSSVRSTTPKAAALQ